MGSLKIMSSIFDEMNFIPKKYSCDYGNVSPPIEIKGVPKNAKSLVLMIDDKDDILENHFIVWNIPPETRFIEEGTIPYDAIIGRNDFGLADYVGPCPEGRRAHRYEFKIFAINKKLDLGNGETKEEVMQAIENHIVDMCAIVGIYRN